MPRALFASPAASDRLERAIAWLTARKRDEEVLLVGATTEAAADLARRVARTRGAVFGWQRATLAQVAAILAAPALAERGLSPAGALPLEALCARVVDALRAAKGLGRFEPVGGFPGLPRALARTLSELRLAGLALEDSPALAALGPIRAAFEAELARAGVADRGLVLRLAIEAARAPASQRSPSAVAAALLDRPVLFLDVPVRTRLERDLCAALAARSPDAFATAASGDARSLGHLSAALEVTAERLVPKASTSLGRLQRYLFSEEDTAPEPLGDDVVILSAPGEARECMEIARLAHQEASTGVPFDRMAVLLRAPGPYRAHVEEALRRAGIPAHFARGTRAPDPAGRAFLALLACKAEGLTARRFAEYLSLGQVPDATVEGAPPDAAAPGDRWMPPDDELVSPRAPASFSDEDDPPDSILSPADPRAPEAPVTAGTLRAPRRWERLLLDSAVIGGLHRWRARLEAMAERLSLELSSLEEGDLAAPRIARKLQDLEALRAYALPLLGALDELPSSATWGEWCQRLSALATRAIRLPERVLSVLAELGPMADVGPVDLAEVRFVLEERLTDLVARPDERRAGRLFVAPIDAARGLDFDVVFIPGLAERIFPQKVVADPILPDDDRRGAGLETNDDRIAEERLALLLAVGAARRRVVLSYPRVDMDQSRPRVPSFYGLEAMRAAEGKLPGYGELGLRADRAGEARLGWPAPSRPELAVDEAEYDLALLEQLFRRDARDTVGTARYLLDQNPHLRRALRFRARRWMLKKWTPVDGLVDPQGLARAALDRHTFAARSFSPTALQKFASCPYRFLLHAVHRLAPREVPEAIEEIGPLERGSLVHETLHELSDALRERGLFPLTGDRLEEARALLDGVLDRVAARFRDDLAPAIDRVWEDGIVSVRADLREWLRRCALEGTWTPFRFELSFGLGERRARDPASRDEPVVIPLPDGRPPLKLRGSIDLVERGPGGELRATDYKTGKARKQAGETVLGAGEVLQPVLYALALEALFPDAGVEGGRLYYCTSAGAFEDVPIPLDATARAAAGQVLTVISRSLEEGFLPAAPAKAACTYCEYRAVCGPYEEIRLGKKSPERLAGLVEIRSLR